MLPYFYGGYLCPSKGLSLPCGIKKKASALLLILSFFIMVLLVHYSSRTLHVLEFYNVDVWSIGNNSNLSIVSLLGVRCLLMISTIVVSYAIIEKVKLSERLSVLGKSTLVIYVVQGILAHIIPSLTPANLSIELAIGVGILLLSFFLIKTIDCKYITNPISTLFDKIKNK